MAGVPGVFWRCPAVLWGPSTHNPTWVQGKPILRKIGRFSLCACGNGVNLPHVAKHAFGDQMGPNVQKPMPFGSPPHQGLKNCGLSQKIFLFFDLFRAHRGDFCGFRAAGHILWLAYFLTVPAAPGRLNATWFQGKPILLSGRCCMAHTAIFTGTGAIFRHAVRGVSRVICG